VRYLTREGEFDPAAYLQRRSAKAKDYSDYIDSGVQHLPQWAGGDPGLFFTIARAQEFPDRYYAFQMEFSLPRELSHEQHMALRADLMEAVLPDLPALWAKHEKQLPNGEMHPHIHILFSARKDDGIVRDAWQMFKRWDRSRPERGGCEKELRWSRRQAPEQLRQAFADITNFHIERAHLQERLDPRSLKRRTLHRKAIGRGGIEPDAPTLAREQAKAWQVWEQRKAYKGLEDIQTIPREEFVLLVRQWFRDITPGEEIPQVTTVEMAQYLQRQQERVNAELRHIEHQVTLVKHAQHHLTLTPQRKPSPDHHAGSGYRVRLTPEEEREYGRVQGHNPGW
jgi:hypothetical protein